MDKKEQLRKEYIRRINMAMDYIDENYNKNISLEDVAKAAYFSPFHFHRVFSTLVGETVHNFISRRRVEKAAVLVLRGYDYTISEIAEKNGFNSPAAFSRAFKKYYGVSASEMQNMTKSQYSKICKVESKNCKNKFTIEDYICNVQKIFNDMKKNTNVEVKEMPEFKVAYMRHTGDYREIGKVFEKLYMWMMKNGYTNKNTKGISVYHDDPKVTEPEKVRTSACFTVDKDFKPAGEVGVLTVKKGKYAVGHFEVTQTEFQDAWNYMCAWTLENGYEEGDGDYYEIYYNNHEEHPDGKFIVDICIPVK